MFARVLLFQKTGLSDDTLTYELSDEFADIEIGALVEVPLRNQTITGILLEKTSVGIAKGKVKPITRVVHPEMLTDWQMKMLNWLSEEYLAPKWKIARQLIPEQIREGKIKIETSIEGRNIAPAQKIGHKITQKKSIFTYELIHDRETFLLTLKKHLVAHPDGQTLVVMPEITIEPFWIEQIQKEFNTINLAKAKTPKQKAIIWKDIFEGKYSVIIGSRSGFFAPLKNLKNIIIINEHNIGHKEDQRPKFHTRDIAEYIARNSDTNITHISTSISMAMLHAQRSVVWDPASDSAKITLPTPSRRTDIQIQWVDMRDERKKHNYLPLSEDLIKTLHATVEHQSQAILFLNKKGRAACMLCKDCGAVPKCPVCERNLIVKTYKGDRSVLFCIAGEKVFEIPEGCTRCGSPELKMVGAGHEKISELLQKEIPEAAVALYSSDEFENPKEQKKILQNFREKKIDILVTTQLLYSMAPVPEVPVVCALNIDTTLTIPHFQSGEKTLHHLQEMGTLLKPRGLFMIQTYIPETPLLKAFAGNTLTQWYDMELASRKTFNYPPWSKIIFLTTAKKDRAKETLDSTMQYLASTRPHLQVQHSVKMVGHTPKRYLVIRGVASPDDLDVIKKMPDIILDVDSPYLM